MNYQRGSILHFKFIRYSYFTLDKYLTKKFTVIILTHIYNYRNTYLQNKQKLGKIVIIQSLKLTKDKQNKRFRNRII